MSIFSDEKATPIDGKLELWSRGEVVLDGTSSPHAWTTSRLLSHVGA